MSNEDPVLRRISVYVCENCIAGVVGQCHVPGCLFIRFNIEDTPQPLKYMIHQPRVFLDGDDVPGGVCVLYENGEVGYLDDTGNCDCEDVERGECEEHSYVNRNGNLGPLVEVLLPDYETALAADCEARAVSGDTR